MTTENGIAPTKKARAHISVLRQYHAWLCCKADDREAMGLPAVLIRRQIDALEYAFVVLEAEFDVLARLNREIIDPADRACR